MFKYEQHKIGRFTKHKLYKGNSSISIIAERGACMNSLIFQAKELLWGYTYESELEQMDWAKSAWLIPFPNRLNQGNYIFEETDFQFPINLAPHAIHGFAMFEAFTLIEVKQHEDFGLLKFEYDYDGKFSYYPFRFRFEVSYQLFENHIVVTCSLCNTDNRSFPVGIGWHPYFSIGGKVENWKLQLPSCQKVEIDNWMIPTGVITSFNVFKQSKTIGNSNFDTCFVINDTQTLQITLSNDEGTLQYSQQTGNQSFNYVQLFIPPNRDCVAIEPMTCGIDAFNQHQNSCLLSPQQSIGGTVRIGWRGN